MNIISKWILERKEKLNAKRHQRIVASANEIFQIKEYGGEIWFVYNHTPICPMTMFKEEAIVECLKDMRKLYIERIEEEIKTNKRTRYEY